jgi:hypothetical protein
VFSKTEEYRRDARRARIQAESARMPQEKEMLLEIERAFERLVVLEEWLEGSQKKGDRKGIVTTSADTIPTPPSVML